MKMRIEKEIRANLVEVVMAFQEDDAEIDGRGAHEQLQDLFKE